MRLYKGEIHMMNIKKLLVIGGDTRQKYMAENLSRKGFDVSIIGFEQSEDFPNLYFVKDEEKERIVRSCDAVILPLPVSRDNENIILQKGQMSISYLVKKLSAQQVIFVGMMDDFYKSEFFKRGIKVFDYFEREELKINNAFPTAQGVLKIILNELPVSLNRMKCCVTGCGKCSKMISEMLRDLGIDVTVSARKCCDLAWAENRKMKGVCLKNLKDLADSFDIIINTVPAQIIGEEILKKLNKSCLLIDIASKPYGIDKVCAEKYKLNLIVAPSLPGKTAPKTAGEIIADTVFNIIREG